MRSCAKSCILVWRQKQEKLSAIVYQHVHVTEHATERSKAAKALKTCRNYKNIRVETK